MSIKIQYIYNSCFTIESESHFLVIDYFRGDLILPPDKKILFLVTHGHADHYTPEIFTLTGAEKAHYLLSDEIRAPRDSGKIIRLGDSPEEAARTKRLYTPSRVRRAHPGESFTWEGLQVHTFLSTDAGMSILFEWDDIFFFHAGDLNAWKWPSMSASEQKKEVEDYKNVLDQVRNFPVHVGFCPVDPRLAENAFLGGNLFLETLNPEIFLPMHFGDDCAITTAFRKQAAPRFRTRIYTIAAPYDTLYIKR